ncbi:hypothetical protein N7456_002224 [Penicillium angulare]|uniref:Uncharacterized protein n=1 Tax=Penicillium angulare TaxID=116970 RepID=A0A9W9G8R1_9EURO|nr:hypothetical protein N7456_002224 [Penicillium angulare]
MSDPRLIDMEPGGESTHCQRRVTPHCRYTPTSTTISSFSNCLIRYESIREFTIPPEKQTGQLGAVVKGGEPHTKSEATALPVTTDSPASSAENELAQKLGRGIIKPSKEDLDFDNAGDAEAAKARRQQGYGPGSGVGG